MKFKTIVSLLIILFVVSLTAMYSFAADDKTKSDEIVSCPVSGHKFLKSKAVATLEHKGTTYYFCCDGSCLEKFKADPDSYAGKITTDCCGGGMKMDAEKAIKVTHKGQDYYFCNEKCKAKFDKDPDAYVANLKKELEAKAHKHGHKCAGKCSKKKSGCPAKTKDDAGKE
jgi:YHS domain-containing protein